MSLLYAVLSDSLYLFSFNPSHVILFSFTFQNAVYNTLIWFQDPLLDYNMQFEKYGIRLIVEINLLLLNKFSRIGRMGLCSWCDWITFISRKPEKCHRRALLIDPFWCKDKYGKSNAFIFSNFQGNSVKGIHMNSQDSLLQFWNLTRLT